MESTDPEVPVYPADPQEHARAGWFEECGGTALAESVAAIIAHRFMRPNVFKQPRSARFDGNEYKRANVEGDDGPIKPMHQGRSQYP